MKFVIEVYIVATRYPKPRELTSALEVWQEAIQSFESDVRLTSAGANTAIRPANALSIRRLNS